MMRYQNPTISFKKKKKKLHIKYILEETSLIPELPHLFQCLPKLPKFAMWVSDVLAISITPPLRFSIKS